MNYDGTDVMEQLGETPKSVFSLILNASIWTRDIHLLSIVNCMKCCFHLLSLILNASIWTRDIHLLTMKLQCCFHPRIITSFKHCVLKQLTEY